MKTYAQMKSEAQGRIREISPEQVMGMQQRGDPFVLVDIRELHEVNAAKIPGSVHVPRSHLESQIEMRVPREATVVIYCASGNRTVLSADTLQLMGYANVAAMTGGIRAWAEAGGEVE